MMIQYNIDDDYMQNHTCRTQHNFSSESKLSLGKKKN